MSDMIQITTWKNENFKVIDLYPIQEDVSISWKAKGLHTYLITRPPGWKIRYSDLVERATDGRSALKAAIEELKQAGYLTIKRQRRADGTFGDSVWAVTENPKKLDITSNSPEARFPQADNPQADNEQGNNKDYNKYNNNKYINNQEEIKNKENNKRKQKKEEVTLGVLESIPEWDFDEDKDLDNLRSLMEEFPRVDFVETARTLKTWLKDNPPAKNANLRLRFRNFVKNSDKWGIHDIEPKEDGFAKRRRELRERGIEI